MPKVENKIELTKTERGFKFGTFIDHYDKKCSIQESSLADVGCLWLGIDDAEPKIMARDTPAGGNGWVPYHIPDNVSLSTRMHINQEQAAALIPLLQHFAETGYLPEVTDAEI